tara:strand:+ start:1125 stop:1352 length:228 start_codon:yes stop_codon:yes gene_type:complete
MTSVVKLFDPSIQKHVEWLYLVHQTAKNLGDVRLEKVCNINPFGLTIKVMDIPEIQFLLDAKYTDAIFEKKAHIL